MTDGLLGAADIRELARQLGITPTKQLGQNFVIDANTVRRIVRLAGVVPDDVVLEVGPGLGSLTLALLPASRTVIAVEIDPRLAAALPATVSSRIPAYASRLQVVTADALTLRDLSPPPTVLVANLPYNVSVPVILHLLAEFPAITRCLVMVQAEVADRLAAPPGSRTYGVPSVKARWYADIQRVGSVSRSIFWPVPNVDSALVSLTRHPPLQTSANREEVFAAVDAAFGQRRKTLRAALAAWAGSPAAAEAICRGAGVDPSARGEQLDVADFARLAQSRRVLG